MTDDEPETPRVTCPGCNGSGEQGCAGGYLETCGTCDGTGAVPPCCVCGKGSVTLYADREDCPSCESPACELRMQAGLDYMQEAGDR